MNIKRNRIGIFFFFIYILFAIVSGLNAYSHEIRPGFLKINEREPGLFDVTWKVPVKGDAVLSVSPVLPDSFKIIGLTSSYKIPGAQIQQSTFESDGPISGKTIIIDGLSAVQTDVMLQINLADGTNYSAILKPDSPTYEIPLEPTKYGVALSYWEMGLIHILDGIDHLLFLFALILLITGFGNLLKTVTAFTIAHSITLGLATLGFGNIPVAPTEAVISLSILFLAVEIVRDKMGEKTITRSYPWIIAFIFGLFHGLGFANALFEVGLPQNNIPLALLMFNIGVETGQIIFIIVILIFLSLLRRVNIYWPKGTWRLAPYAIGAIACYWTIERIISFL
ncbi:MAG: HupE/UreJ family protein [Thermodesulfobacteriota bacterium]